jgi:hypothetical protein
MGYYLLIRPSFVSGSRVGEGCCRIYISKIPVTRYKLYLGIPNKYRYVNKSEKWYRPTPWRSTHTLWKWHFTYAHEKITDFPLSIFTKFTNYLQISYTEFQPICEQTWKVRVEIHSQPYAKYGSRCVDFHETHNHSIILCITYTNELHPNEEIGDNEVKTHTSLRTVPLSMPRFLQNSQLLCGIMWKSPIHNFTKTGQERGKVCI